MAVVGRLGMALLLVLLVTGCATTYVPVSWGEGDKARQLSRSDLMLSTLFNRYDPERKTLRVAGDSFDEVMMPSEVKFHLGAYRPDTKMIYRNLYHDYSPEELRDLILHELAHHVWYNFMSAKKRALWRSHLAEYPTPLQRMVRRNYPPSTDYNSEDFAFTVEYARPEDIHELALLDIITPQEEEAILKEQADRKSAAEPRGVTRTVLMGGRSGTLAQQPLEGMEP